MIKLHKFFSLGLAALLTGSLVLPALAADDMPADPAAEGSGAVQPLLDKAELDAMMASFMEERGLDETNFSLAFCYTGTGETWFYNEDTYFEGASLYKLPLMMAIARKVSSGELQQTDQIYGIDISYMEEMALTYSNNEISEMMIGYFQPFKDYRTMLAEIAGIPIEEVPDDFFRTNTFSARFMLGVLQNLYDNPDTFPNVIPCLKNAQPDQFFRLRLEGEYEIAQKYGSAASHTHTAGIIYTPTPCLLVVMTKYAYAAERVIGDAAELFANYSLTMDQRLAQRIAEEEAAEQARLEEEARLKAEQEAAEQARLEAEQAAAEEQARLKAEQEAAEQARLEAERLQQEQQQQQATRAMMIVVVLLLVLLIGLTGFYCLRKFRRRP